MTNIDNLDTMLLNLIQDNIEKIKSTTPKNPSIEKGDEWRPETNWDNLHKELATK